MHWRRLGHIFVPDQTIGWMQTHAMMPIADRIDGDLYRVFFTARDKLNRGHGGFITIDMRNPLKVEYVHPDPVIEPGELGCFDDSGALPNTLIAVGGRKRLYYDGINLGVTVKIRNAAGLAEWNEERLRFDRLFPGPVLDRTRDLPHFATAPDVLFEDGRYRAWFSTCRRWEMVDGEPRHYYNIEYAESADGIAWNRDGRTAIDFADAHEYAITLPRVKRDADRYRMWFCSRATPTVPSYRIRYAESDDGLTWTRNADGPGLEVAGSGWDSEMTCYPFVFDHAGQRYLMYNGNGYGRTGFGIAVQEG
jgi:hypothetical protein